MTWIVILERIHRRGVLSKSLFSLVFRQPYIELSERWKFFSFLSNFLAYTWTLSSDDSRKYWKRMEAAHALGSYFLNESSNPLYNWNILFMKYCDGSSYSSHVEHPVKVPERNNHTVFYRGQLVHEGFMDEFIANHGLLEGTRTCLPSLKRRMA